MGEPAPASLVAPDFTGQLVATDKGVLRLVSILGEGAQGVVYRASVEENPSPSSSSSSSSSSPEPTEYAIKMLCRADPFTPQGEAQIREVVMHKICSNHPNVLTLHEVLEDEGFIILVLDYCSGGDFYSAIVDELHYCRKDELAKKVYIQLLDAVQSCHEKGIYHRDLKPENIFVDESRERVFLGDFGLSTDDEITEGYGCGSSYYMSPEAVGEDYQTTSYPNAPSDVWALGVILINIITGRNPWKLASFEDYYFHRFMANPDNLCQCLPIPKPVGEILKRIFAYKGSRRISIPKLKDAIVRLDAFFLTEEEVAEANDEVRSVYHHYSPRRIVASDATTDIPSLLSTSTTLSSAFSEGPETPHDGVVNEGGYLPEDPSTNRAILKANSLPPRASGSSAYDQLIERLDDLVV